MNQYIVTVQYAGNYRHYDFKYEAAVMDIRQGDKVVVESSTGLGVAEVTMVVKLAVNEAWPTKVKAWVVQRIYIEPHEIRKNRAKLAEELKKKMEARRKEIQDATIYEDLAAKDEEMAKLLQEYKNVTG